ncbi:transglycosylase SLT domain-containing protein [Hydrogenophaga sp. A37]|uniref:transglycosylase SLT domain-containing protein n=1 Tax=Hydrogenophaga sp. A37 TaxID=1945864 RepID=UPI0009848693|nr:transglycosylase SLT domain-containing protein [Hydrogenophaga sp. A37]OOG89021.1 lytic transglycosylase [Hydrogenophaga sp. A37]
MTSPLPRAASLAPSSQRLKLATLGLALLLGACASAPPPRPTAPRAAAASAAPAPVVKAPSAELPPHAPLTDIAMASATPPPVVMLSAPTDIWDRIRRGLAMSDLDNDMVRDREQWYASRPDYMQRMTERSSRYLFHIVEEVERRNLPMELALLPFIESAFNPQAVSSARAAGMWQFMPATGQSFDLRQNVFRDDRRDVLASTRAALDYLEQLHARFGDWHLALAAYNWGQGNVNKAITRNRQAGLPATYNDINMPLETRMYVPKLQAVENIVARPEAFSAQLPLIGNHPFFDTLTLERDIDVTLIANLADISEKDFRALNPSITQPIVMAAGTPYVLLPWDNADIFERRLANYKGPLASWTAWVVPGTMTVAEVASRVGMNESELRRVNNIPPRMKVQAGSSLLVPRNGHRDKDVSEFVADNASLSLQPETIVRRGTVIVRRGDTLGSLATRHGVSTANLARWNNMRIGTKLKSGQRLSLAKTPRTSVAIAKKSSKRPLAKENTVKRTRTVAVKSTRAVSKGKSKKSRKN